MTDYILDSDDNESSLNMSMFDDISEGFIDQLEGKLFDSNSEDEQEESQFEISNIEEAIGEQEASLQSIDYSEISFGAESQIK